jgi:hypothetical protein
MNGNYSSSPKKEGTTGRPDRDPLATQDDPAKFLTQDRIISMPDQLLSVALHGTAVSLRNRTRNRLTGGEGVGLCDLGPGSILLAHRGVAAHSLKSPPGAPCRPLRRPPSWRRPVRAPGSHTGRPRSARRLVAPAKPRRPPCDTAHDGPPDSRLARRPWTARRYKVGTGMPNISEKSVSHISLSRAGTVTIIFVLADGKSIEGS